MQFMIYDRLDWRHNNSTTKPRDTETISNQIRSEKLKQMQISILENIFIVMVFLISEIFFSV